MASQYEYRLELRVRFEIARHLFGFWTAVCARHGVSRLHPLAILVLLEAWLLVARYRIHVTS